jgi:hypothetical protein
MAEREGPHRVLSPVGAGPSPHSWGRTNVPNAVTLPSSRNVARSFLQRFTDQLAHRNERQFTDRPAVLECSCVRWLFQELGHMRILAVVFICS